MTLAQCSAHVGAPQKAAHSTRPSNATSKDPTVLLSWARGNPGPLWSRPAPTQHHWWPAAPASAHPRGLLRTSCRSSPLTGPTGSAPAQPPQQDHRGLHVGCPIHLWPLPLLPLTMSPGSRSWWPHSREFPALYRLRPNKAGAKGQCIGLPAPTSVLGP